MFPSFSGITGGQGAVHRLPASKRSISRITIVKVESEASFDITNPFGGVRFKTYLSQSNCRFGFTIQIANASIEGNRVRVADDGFLMIRTKKRNVPQTLE